MNGAIGVIRSLDNRQIGGFLYWNVQANIDPIQGKLLGWKCRAKQFWLFEIPADNVAMAELYWVEKCEMLRADTVKVRLSVPPETELNKIHKNELEMIRHE